MCIPCEVDFDDDYDVDHSHSLSVVRTLTHAYRLPIAAERVRERVCVMCHRKLHNFNCNVRCFFRY